MRRVGSSGDFTVYGVPGERGLVTAEPAVVDGGPLQTFASSRYEAIPGPDRIVAAFPYLWQTPAAATCGVGSVIGGGAALARAGGRWIFATPYGARWCMWRRAAELAAAPNVLFVAGGWAAQPTPRPLPPDQPLAGAASYTERPGHWDAALRRALARQRRRPRSRTAAPLVRLPGLAVGHRAPPGDGPLRRRRCGPDLARARAGGDCRRDRADRLARARWERQPPRWIPPLTLSAWPVM
jgi:hypothetical protein